LSTSTPVGISRYKAVVDAFASDIRAGRLPSGTRLPTHRLLAAREGIALVTASRVYAELEAMGLVSGEQGRGTSVRDIALPPGHGHPSSYFVWLPLAQDARADAPVR
jgi:DNA-binding transcriptional regulator YhcF (GntR family)